jgi:hypothetical protein
VTTHSPDPESAQRKEQVINDRQVTIVEGYRLTGATLDLSTLDAWTPALDQRAFGPHRLLVVTAWPSGPPAPKPPGLSSEFDPDPSPVNLEPWSLVGQAPVSTNGD